MKFIRKDPSNEPREVQEKRLTPGSTFDALPKKPLRLALLKEQGYLCAYCMKRIHNDSKKTRIEHWAPRTAENEKNYSNLLCTCDGNEGNKGNEHCDVLKKNRAIRISPLEKECEILVRFDPGGKAYSKDEHIEMEINEILGLNRSFIVEERRRLLDILKGQLNALAGKNRDKKLKRSQVRKLLEEWQKMKKGKYEPYCQVAIQYLQNKLRRMA